MNSIPQYFAAHMVKSMKIKCYRSYKSKQCLDIHEVLLAQIVSALWHSKRMLVSHSLNQLLHKIQSLC